MSRDRSNYLLVLIVLVFGLLNIFFGERILVQNGLGYDGANYGRWAKDFCNEICRPGNIQIFKRIFPSLMVHLGLRALHIPLIDRNIIRGFEVYNLIMMLLIAYIWGRLADLLKLETREKWFGLGALFLNFSLAKLNLYYPVTTDTSAFAMGLLLLYLYLADMRIGVYIVTVIGTFSWPTFIMGGLILSLFPVKYIEDRPLEDKFHIKAALSVTLLCVGYINLRHFANVFVTLYPERYLDVNDDTSILTLAYLSAYLFFGLKPLLNSANLFRGDKTIKTRNIVFVLVFLAVFLIILIYSLHRSALMAGGVFRLFVKFQLFLDLMLLGSMKRPFYPTIPHIIWYGPIVIMTIFLWKDICRTIHRYGKGMTLYMSFHFLMTMLPSGRQMVNFIPFFIVFTVKVMSDLRLKAGHYWLITIIAFIYSKAWLNINSSGILSPIDKYVMNFGYFMSNTMYIIQGGVVILTVILFYSVFSGYLFTDKD